MTGGVTILSDNTVVTIHVPMALRKRGGRKVVVAPEGSDWASSRPRVDNTLVKALARAFRWQKLLETGVYATVEEIAAAEMINASYVGRVLRLTLLAPDIVEAILDGRQPAEIPLNHLLAIFSANWEEQREAFRLIPEGRRFKSGSSPAQLGRFLEGNRQDPHLRTKIHT